MSKVTPSNAFKAIASQVVATGVPVAMTKQDLRSHFGNFTKLGRLIKDDISRELRKLKVTTEPSFRGKDVGEFMLIPSRPRATRAAGTISTAGEAGQEGPVIVPEMDENGGDLSELRIANKIPSFVAKNAEPRVLFQRLVESGKRGIVLVVDRVENSPGSSEPGKQIIRKPLGVVTWESFSRAIIGAPHGETNGAVQLPAPQDAMDRDIALAFGTDDLVQSLQRIEQKGVLVVLNSNESIAGIATKRDILAELAEDLIPYQLISLIENLLRTKIEEADFGPEVFQTVSQDPKIKSLEDLTFSNYVGLFSNDEYFSKIKVHGAPSEMGKLLDKVRLLRNQLMHFNQLDEVDYSAELKAHYEAIRKLFNED